jgi:N-acetylglucosamine kinase-like BadF-type ATPase
VDAEQCCAPSTERLAPCIPRNGTSPLLQLAGRIAYSFDMRCVLGFDGGGTKTDCVLMDESRQIRGRARSGPSNPKRVGLEAAFAALLEAAEKALAVSGISADDVATIHGGIAGLGAAGVTHDLVRMFKPKFPTAVVLLNNDLSMALAATEEIPSIVVIAGTGSAVLGRNSPEKLAREGGWGPILGDPGSAYDIGRKAIVLSLRHVLRGQNSTLGNEILHRFHCNWVELQDQIRANADGVFPEVFPIVAKAAEKGDEGAHALLDSAAEELAEMAARVIEALGLRDQAFFLAKTGGVFGRSRVLDDRFDSRVAQVAPNARIGTLRRPMAEFAARAAVNCLDSPVRNVGG